jgi:hypothetical protein
MAKGVTLYGLCDASLARGNAAAEPGRQLKLLYRHSAGHPGLKWTLLFWCRHPGVTGSSYQRLRQMLETAMGSRLEQWGDRVWLQQTFQPLADLLNEAPRPQFRQRNRVNHQPALPSDGELWTGRQAVLRDVFRVWDLEPADPWFPVAAQCVLTGDDLMDGKNFLNVLVGLGSMEYQATLVMMSLIRCFLLANPRTARLLRPMYRGVSEPMFQRVGWIWHRTAYYDAIFFDQLLNFLEKGDPSEYQRDRVQEILENLVKFSAVVSQEPMKTPTRGIEHPAITCLPKDKNGTPLCHMTDSDWDRKAKLGFSDFVPDVDTTFLTLSLARKWIRRGEGRWKKECAELLDHPWPDILEEYQLGSEFRTNPPTITISQPLDYQGAVPIWFDKPFHKADGRIVREALGNEVCPGHNMDVLESLLVNRQAWNLLEGSRLKVAQRLLHFHYTAFTAGNALKESAYIYYLPEINVFYAGRVYAAYRGMTEEERNILDPELKMEAIREIALRYAREEVLGQTFNVFDAALAVAALALLQDDEPGHLALARGLRLILDQAGEGPKGHPYRAYEWNKMRHPTRILVGSEVSTSLFVLNALTEARHFLFGRKSSRQRSGLVAEPVLNHV